MDGIERLEQSERASYRLFSPPAGETDDSARKRAWKGDDFSFHDFLDIINPLQHLPIVSTLYRWVTGDTIGALPRMIGDGLYGGPIGFVAGLINAEIKQESGRDVGEQVIALLGGDTAAPAADAKTIAAKEAAPDSGGTQANDAAGDAVATPAGTAVAASSSGVGMPGAATPVSAPAPSHGTVAAAPAMAAAASDPNDPRALFLARTNMLHRQLAADNGSLPGRALSNHVVPLQGIAIPPGLVRRGAPVAAAAARPVAIDESGTAPALPANPPIVISQQMMDALDKYARLQQQRETKTGASRGAQVDLSQ